jgi:hypothetical protein
MTRIFAAIALVALLAPPAGAQMPDPRAMSGVPLPVSELAPGTVTVRVVRGSLTNALADQTVEIVGGAAASMKTNAEGRAEFSGLPVGATVKAVATVDGERIESQEFPLPSNGGVRLMLVAADAGTVERAEEDKQLAASPPKTGIVVFGEQSRFVIELGDGALNVFNIFEIQNTARVPVQPAVPIVFPMPEGGEHLAVLDGSSPLAVAAGDRVNVGGPFPPGTTLVQFAYTMPYTGGSASITQRLPAGLAQLSVVAQKAGELTLASPQIRQQRDVTTEGQTYILGQGPPLAAGTDVTFTFAGLPHAPLWPRNVALALAGLLLLGGAYGAMRGTHARGAAAERERLGAERERLFARLTALEAAHREGSVDPTTFGVRRRELVVALERIYAALDEEVAA